MLKVKAKSSTQLSILTSACRGQLAVRVHAYDFTNQLSEFFDLDGDAGGAGSEDCLKVNVYAPAGAKPGDKRTWFYETSFTNTLTMALTVPVLVYIHGGGTLPDFGTGVAILTIWQISSPSPAEIAPRNNGNYDCLAYKYFGYPKVAKNMLETSNHTGIVPSQANPVAERILLPRYLCFLRDGGKPAVITNVDEW